MKLASSIVILVSICLATCAQESAQAPGDQGRQSDPQAAQPDPPNSSREPPPPPGAPANDANFGLERVDRALPKGILAGCLSRLVDEFAIRYPIFVESFKWLDRPVTFGDLVIAHQIYATPVEDLTLLVWIARAPIRTNEECHWQAVTIGSIQRGVYQLWAVTSQCDAAGAFALERFEQQDDSFVVTGSGWRWTKTKDSLRQAEAHDFGLKSGD